MTRSKASTVRVRSARKGHKAPAIMFPTDAPKNDQDILEQMDDSSRQDTGDTNRQMEDQDFIVRPDRASTLGVQVGPSPPQILMWDEWNAAADEDRAAHSAALEARADCHLQAYVDAYLADKLEELKVQHVADHSERQLMNGKRPKLDRLLIEKMDTLRLAALHWSMSDIAGFRHADQAAGRLPLCAIAVGQ